MAIKPNHQGQKHGCSPGGRFSPPGAKIASWQRNRLCELTHALPTHVLAGPVPLVQFDSRLVGNDGHVLRTRNKALLTGIGLTGTNLIRFWPTPWRIRFPLVAREGRKFRCPELLHCYQSVKGPPLVWRLKVIQTRLLEGEKSFSLL